MSSVADSDFGKEVGLVHKVLLNGRKAGVNRSFWSALADDVELFKRVSDFVDNQFIQVYLDEKFRKDSVRYGTIRAWAAEFRIELETIKTRIKGTGMMHYPGKGMGGNVSRFYSEPDIRKACADLLGDDQSPKGSVRYATISTWSEKLGVAAHLIKERLEKAGVIYRPARTTDDRICRFYSEPDVKRVCADLFTEHPQVSEDGFIHILEDGELKKDDIDLDGMGPEFADDPDDDNDNK